MSLIFFIQPLIVILLSFMVLFLTHYYFKKSTHDGTNIKLNSQIIMSAEVFIFLFLFIILLPLKDNLKGQILSFLGILLSATIAISSTTVLGNIMAGIMLRSISSLKMGDFIITGDYLGRISEKGLFHIEIQTEDRNLVTIPNIFLIAKPIKVIHSSGTIISSEISLGYDLPPDLIKNLLIEAAKNSGLKEPFVYTVNLGDFSILYRVSGLLSEVKYLISANSKLNDEILRILHKNSIEIVSPNFMNTRSVNDLKFIPKDSLENEAQNLEVIPEDTVFGKADIAERLEDKIKQLEDIKNKIDEVEKVMGSVSEEIDKKTFQDKLNRLKEFEIRLNAEIERSKNDLNKEDS
ncbi:hypothetical protein PM10SUCC1_22530 [Propionigenium maris DSM 9537]|uniref:Mechanosensitive ion channel MscS domain-containing protein n=1 Tax=Propionigenium maris DSM 9537 TaxID=1123000 RepID=A0A9W6GKC8_9FUSO|nr:mechanosensitive ion channel domain-containing protein [Propionigenium maris]GLI56739.1 hypothetical protein PM10SUCC1_22530 [Propionigenium maris DSM 9537]